MKKRKLINEYFVQVLIIKKNYFVKVEKYNIINKEKIKNKILIEDKTFSLLNRIFFLIRYL